MLQLIFKHQVTGLVADAKRYYVLTSNPASGVKLLHFIEDFKIKSSLRLPPLCRTAFLSYGLCTNRARNTPTRPKLVLQVFNTYGVLNVGFVTNYVGSVKAVFPIGFKRLKHDLSVFAHQSVSLARGQRGFTTDINNIRRPGLFICTTQHDPALYPTDLPDHVKTRIRESKSDTEILAWRGDSCEVLDFGLVAKDLANIPNTPVLAFSNEKSVYFIDLE